MLKYFIFPLPFHPSKPSHATTLMSSVFDDRREIDRQTDRNTDEQYINTAY